jgi:hypothetical protein
MRVKFGKMLGTTFLPASPCDGREPYHLGTLADVAVRVRDGAVKLRVYRLDRDRNNMVNVECIRVDLHIAEVAQAVVKDKDGAAVNWLKNGAIYFTGAPPRSLATPDRAAALGLPGTLPPRTVFL